MSASPLNISRTSDGQRAITVGIFMAWRDWDSEPSIFALAVEEPTEESENWCVACETMLRIAYRATLQLFAHVHLAQRTEPPYSVISLHYLVPSDSVFQHWIPGSEFPLSSWRKP